MTTGTEALERHKGAVKMNGPLSRTLVSEGVRRYSRKWMLGKDLSRADGLCAEKGRREECEQFYERETRGTHCQGSVFAG